MLDIQQLDTEEAAESPTTSNARKPARALKLLLAVAAVVIVAVMGAIIIVQRRSGLEWYTSPPIDAQGRRIHILIPVRYISSADAMPSQDMWPTDTAKNGKILEISPDLERRESFVHEWLTKLRIISSLDDPRAFVSIHVKKDVCRDINEYMKVAYPPDGKVHPKFEGMPNGQWMFRAFSIQGSDQQVCVIYSSLQPKQDRTELATKICSSMYVK